LILNTAGEKYEPVEFSHAAHANARYTKGIECVTCHHTHEGDGPPDPCSDCHDVGGEADEDRKKTRSAHEKAKPFPFEPGQEEVSCLGCHKAQNAVLSSGGRSGKKAPTKCTGCHSKKAR